LISKYLQKLSDNNIDTILIFENGCVACESFDILEVNDSIINFGNPQISYVFWKKEGANYLTKIIDHDLYCCDTISFESNLIWELYFKNKAKIIKEQILPPTYLDGKDTVELDIDHYSFSQIKLIDVKDIVEFEINEFYFSRFINENTLNINYDKNTMTLRRKLQNQIIKDIKYIEDNKLNKITSYKKHIVVK
jgi:hypothetical protein